MAFRMPEEALDMIDSLPTIGGAGAQVRAGRGVPPRHIALIADGNRRWARRRGLPDAEGHRRGFLDVAPRLIERAAQRGLRVLTLWLFSGDNWNRSPREIADLMTIYASLVERAGALSDDIAVRHAGSRARIPASLRAALDAAAARGPADPRTTVVLAIDHGGAAHAAAPLRALLAHPAAAALSDLELLAALDARDAELPPPDLVVRTSGAQRLSGFAPAASAFAELAFVDRCFPELTPSDIDAFIADFAARERRFGR
ncbi:MAG TPA: polyprenyl diphosphate synthase [Dongiaceae bacterium]|nr:polyprenyl diphosphate synthase [Dongiaceae bacterium]